MATASERRSAQRQTARQVHEGTYKPSAIGKKAREAASKRIPVLIDQIQALKKKHFGDRIKWNKDRSRKNVQVDPATGNHRKLKELKDILDDLNE